MHMGHKLNKLQMVSSTAKFALSREIEGKLKIPWVSLDPSSFLDWLIHGLQSPH